MKPLSELLGLFSPESGDKRLSVDYDSLLGALGKSDHKVVVRFAAIVAVALLMITLVSYYAITFINDILLYENRIHVNEQGAFNPHKAMDCEYALYLFNTADVWANSGIQLNKKDRYRINISGACNTDVAGVISAAENNIEQQYPWVCYDCTPQGVYHVQSTDNSGLQYCLYRGEKDKVSYGSILYGIYPESDDLLNHPIIRANEEKEKQTKVWQKSAGTHFTTADHSGILFLSANDLLFDKEEEIISYYDAQINNPQISGKDRDTLIAQKGRRLDRYAKDKNNYVEISDNLGQLMVSVEIQRYIPGTFFRPMMAYRYFEYRTEEIYDSDHNGFIKLILVVGAFLKYSAWILALFALVTVILLLILYGLFYIGHMMGNGIEKLMTMRKLFIIGALVCLCGYGAKAQEAAAPAYEEETGEDIVFLDDEEIDEYMLTLEEPSADTEESAPSAGQKALLVLLAALPGAVLLYYVLRKDRLHPEPPRQLVKAFIYGLFTVPLAIPLSMLFVFIGLAPEASTFVLGKLGGAFLGAAIPEESAKLFILWLFLRKCKDFDEHMDGIVYAVCVGMGFAIVENIMYVLSYAQAINFDFGVQVGLSRAFLSVPGHFGFAVLMGYFYSMAAFRPASERKMHLMFAWLLPVIAHGLYDFFLSFGTEQSSPLSLLVMMAFFGVFFYTQQLGSRSIARALARDRVMPPKQD